MPTQLRFYSSTAAKTTLAASISSSATSLTLAAASNLPSEYPYTLILEKDTANEEVVEVTSLIGSAYQITRNIDSSGAKAHAFGANVEHGVSARDFTESRQHEVATSGHHGVTGNIVGTGGAQTLTSKTLTTPIIAGATISGAFTSTATITGGTITGATITGLSTPTNTSDAATKGYIDTQTVSAAASASSASVSASSAATSASSAATSASSALTSQTSAATNASSAATSASSALTSQTSAATSASSASASATAAATSATSAATSASSAVTSASSALTSQTSAATSASSAAASATAASTSASSATTSATNAATSATSAGTSATASATSAGQAATSATSAATSATSAAASATAAATSATSAGASATTASNSAATATTQATNAATSAASAATSASSAGTSATAAASSATSAASSYDSFDDRYLGAKSAAPSVDNDGNALLTGALYWNTAVNKMYVWSGSAWTEISSSAEIIAYKYTATAGATSVSGADDNSLTLSYTVGKEQVYINGVLQVRGTDYVATTGSSITGMAALTASDIVTVLAFTAFSVSNTYTQAEADAKFVQNAGDFSAGKNKIINGNFGVWQRGTSFTVNNNTLFTADRWILLSTNTGGNVVASQQTFTPGTAPVAGYEGTFFLRNTATSPTGASFNVWQHKIEDARTFANQTVTLSFWAKADSTRTVISQFFQNFGSGGSTEVYTGTSYSYSVSTSWQRFTTTLTFPSISGKTIGTGSNVRLEFVLPVNVSSTVDIWGVQLEAGSVATAFQTASGSIQGELALCQRYLPAIRGNANAIIGYAYSTTACQIYIKLPVTARASVSGITVNPTLAGNYVLVNQGFTSGTPTAIAHNSGGTDYASINVTTTAGSPTLVVGQPVQFQTASADGYILFTGCEL